VSLLRRFCPIIDDAVAAGTGPTIVASIDVHCLGLDRVASVSVAARTRVTHHGVLPRMTRRGTRSSPGREISSLDAELRHHLQQLGEQATTHVVRWPGREPIWTVIYDLTRGLIDRRPRYTTGQLPTLNSPWQDTDSGRYFRWRCRQANLHGGQAFVVEYVVCPRCRVGWVDKPYTIERYQRGGLATAALRALRAEHPGMAWHTGSGHMRSSKAFWAAVGAGVEGAYRQRELCIHVSRHGGVLPDWLLRRQGRL
jgi:hypothetical protein